MIVPALVGALYAGMTLILMPISYGPMQFRVSEVLCVLPYFLPETAWGLWIGCVIANIYSAYGILDIVFGSLATLGAGLCTARIGKRWRETGEEPRLLECTAACLMPSLWNGVIIGGILAWTLTPGTLVSGWVLMGGQIALEETAVMLIGGLFLMRHLMKNGRWLGLLRGQNSVAER